MSMTKNAVTALESHTMFILGILVHFEMVGLYLLTQLTYNYFFQAASDEYIKLINTNYHI